jgi:hypothetical protein
MCGQTIPAGVRQTHTEEKPAAVFERSQ